MGVLGNKVWQSAVLGVLLSLAVLPCSTGGQAPKQSSGHVPVVEDLVQLLQVRPDLREALEGAIRAADLKTIENTEALFDLLDESVAAVPNVAEHRPPREFNLFYIINHAPEDRLNRDDSFIAWMKKYMEARGHFMDTPASAARISSYTALPNWHMDDYITDPSGWMTFNQFFAREVKPGRRPITEPSNDKVIVSPADSVFEGAWDINSDSKVTVKGVTWPIAKLLDGSPYQDAFKNGVYTHSFLNANDYHRYHLPVAGQIKEVRKIQGRVYMDMVRKADGSLQAVDGDTYQYNQERGLIIVDSPEVGLVAVLPIGMGPISSVNLTPDMGARLQKGDEFGYFMFGGSDIVMLFQSKNIVIDAEVGKKYLQGQRIGEVR
ncbi:MAG TPA: phosphatidylserine decarboxylase [Terracidiphilus sp.]|nr:phosphatidylserine decarboxylase [Terracidiphilus sp.]